MGQYAVNQDDSSENTPQPHPSMLQEFVQFLRTLAIIFAIAFSIRVAVVEPFKIPSGSMIPTLQVGDFIVVLKFWYGLRVPLITDYIPNLRASKWGNIFRAEPNSLAQWSFPKRGDVVVFTRPDDPDTPNEDDSEIHIIKRVIGLPGESIQVRDARVFIDGHAIEEPYARWSEGGKFEGNFGPQVVPEGHVLLLGDNRDNSKDSRFWTNPFLDVRRIKGKAVLVFWSWDSLSRMFTRIR